MREVKVCHDYDDGEVSKHGISSIFDRSAFNYFVQGQDVVDNTNMLSNSGYAEYTNPESSCNRVSKKRRCEEFER